MTEQKLAEWIKNNQVGIDEYEMVYNDTVKVSFKLDGIEMPLERISCDTMNRVHLKLRADKIFCSIDYSNLTDYLREKLSDAIEAMTPKD